LRDRDLMQGAVELPIPVSIEAIAEARPAGRGEGGHPGIRGKFGSCRKAVDRADFADDLRGREHPQAGQRQELGGDRCNESC